MTITIAITTILLFLLLFRFSSSHNFALVTGIFRIYHLGPVFVSMQKLRAADLH